MHISTSYRKSSFNLKKYWGSPDAPAVSEDLSSALNNLWVSHWMPFIYLKIQTNRRKPSSFLRNNREWKTLPYYPEMLSSPQCTHQSQKCSRREAL